MYVQLVNIKNDNDNYTIRPLDINDSVDFDDIKYDLSLMKNRDEIMGNISLRKDFTLLNVLENLDGDLFALVETE